jgi:GPH family glycoside/pentoside/hexuronide:cation symporter
VLFVCMLAVFVGYGAATSLAIHANTFFWRLPNQVTFYVLVAVQLGILVGIALSVILADRTEKRTVVRVGLIVALTSFISLPWLQIWGLLPPPGPVLYAIIVGNAFLVVGVISGGVAIAFQSALADAADEHEYMFGTRREGLYYAGLNFAVKCAGGLGGLVGGVGLDLIHFPTGLVGHGGLGVHIPADTIRNLGLLQGMSAAVMYALATVVFFFYRLTRAKHAVILEELRERRRGAEPV